MDGLEFMEKTKYLPVGKELCNIQLENHTVESCSDYVYLRAIFDSVIGKNGKQINQKVVRSRTQRKVRNKDKLLRIGIEDSSLLDLKKESDILLSRTQNGRSCLLFYVLLG